MRRTRGVLLVAVTAFLACEFDVPLETAHTLAIDPEALGLWEPVPEDDQEEGKSERMLILRFSDTEYLVHHPIGGDDVYWRAYPIRIGGIDCVQLETIGMEGRPSGLEDDDRYHVAAYRLADGKLTIRLLNPDLVDDDAETTEELRASFLAHKDNPRLFVEPSSWRRVQPGKRD